MAAKAEQEQEIPTTFPPDQLFVAVSESSQEFAGFDGGPKHRGRGLWPKGLVAQWTSTLAVPLALRDPQTGLIWQGYLEPVTKHSYGLNGVIVCNESQKFYALPEQVAAKPKKEAKPVKVAVPTEKASKRAKSGPAPLAAEVQKLGTAQPLAASASGRASDALVG